MPSSAAPRTTGRPAAASSSRAVERGGGVEVVVERGPYPPQAVLVGAERLHDPVRVHRFPDVHPVGGHRAPRLEPGRGPDQVVVGPLPVEPVVVRQQGEPYRGRLPLLQQLAHEDQVAERLRHLRALEADQAHVEPVADERHPGGGLRLGRLALVVREDEVPSTAVHVDRLPQLAQDERRALDVPPGPSRAPTRLPGRLVGQRRLPQHEVERVPLVGVVGVPPVLGGHGQHGGRVEVADLPEAGEGGHVEVDRPAGLVGVTRVEHRADQGEDLGDGGRGPRLGPRGDEAEGGHVVVEPGDLLGGQVQIVHPELAGLAEDVVVDIGDVAHAPRVVPEIAQASLEDVEGQVDLGVTEVGRVVGGDPARVEGDELTRLEGDDLLAGRVVEVDHRERASPLRRRGSRPAARRRGPCGGCSR